MERVFFNTLVSYFARHAHTQHSLLLLFFSRFSAPQSSPLSSTYVKRAKQALLLNDDRASKPFPVNTHTHTNRHKRAETQQGTCFPPPHEGIILLPLSSLCWRTHTHTQTQDTFTLREREREIKRARLLVHSLLPSRHTTIATTTTASVPWRLLRFRCSKGSHEHIKTHGRASDARANRRGLSLPWTMPPPPPTPSRTNPVGCSRFLSFFLLLLFLLLFLPPPSRLHWWGG